MMDTERVIVIGSNSFSGAHFVDYLLDRNIPAIGISRSAEPHDVFLPHRQRKNANFRFHQLDINHDLDHIMDVIQNSQAEYVINFAAQGMVGQSWQQPGDWFRTNTLSTVLFHDRLRKFDFLRKYVHISTPEVYGSTNGLISENRQYFPSTPYAVSRAATDMSLHTFNDAYHFPVVFTRAANVYGPGQQLYRIIPRSILYFLLGRKLQLHGGGVSVRSFIHIKDVADGTWRAAVNGVPGQIYHLSSMATISICALVEMIADQMRVEFREHVEVAGDRLGKDSAYLLDSSLARNTLEWEDKISLEQGIEETIGWVVDNLDTLKKQPFDYIHKP